MSLKLLPTGTKDDFKAILKAYGLRTSGNKDILRDRIKTFRDSNEYIQWIQRASRKSTFTTEANLLNINISNNYSKTEYKKQLIKRIKKLQKPFTSTKHDKTAKKYRKTSIAKQISQEKALGKIGSTPVALKVKKIFIIYIGISGYDRSTKLKDTEKKDRKRAIYIANAINADICFIDKKGTSSLVWLNPNDLKNFLCWCAKKFIDRYENGIYYDSVWVMYSGHGGSNTMVMSNEEEVIRNQIWLTFEFKIFKRLGYKVCVGWWDCCEGAIDASVFIESGEEIPVTYADNITAEELYDRYNEEKASENEDMSLNESLQPLFHKIGKHKVQPTQNDSNHNLPLSVNLGHLTFNYHTQESGKTADFYGGVLYGLKTVIEKLIDDYDVKHFDSNQMMRLINYEMKKENYLHKLTCNGGYENQYMTFTIADTPTETFIWRENKSGKNGRQNKILTDKRMVTKEWGWCDGEKKLNVPIKIQKESNPVQWSKYESLGFVSNSSDNKSRRRKKNKYVKHGKYAMDDDDDEECVSNKCTICVDNDTNYISIPYVCRIYLSRPKNINIKLRKEFEKD
eukprot:191625_1